MLIVQLENPQKTGRLFNIQIYNHIFIKLNKNFFIPFFLVPELTKLIIIDTETSKNKSQLINKIRRMWVNYKSNPPVITKITWITEKIPAFTPVQEQLFIDTINGMLGIHKPVKNESVYEFSRKHITPLHIIEFLSGIRDFSKSYSVLLYVFDENNNFIILPMIDTVFPSIAPGPIMVIKKEKFMNMLKTELSKNKNTVMAITLPLSDPFYLITYASLEKTRALSLFICDDELKEHITLTDGQTPQFITGVRDSMIALPFNSKYSLIVPDTLTHNKIYITNSEIPWKVIDKTVNSIRFNDNKFMITGKNLNDTHYIRTHHKLYSKRTVTRYLRECIGELLINQKV